MKCVLRPNVTVSAYLFQLEWSGPGTNSDIQVFDKDTLDDDKLYGVVIDSINEKMTKSTYR